MEKHEHIFKKLQSEYTVKCMFTQCDDCSKIIDSQGYHDLQVFQVYKTEKFTKCEMCKGEGITHETCEECNGDGVITCPDCDGEGTKDEECDLCDGKAELPVEEAGELIKTETVKKE